MSRLAPPRPERLSRANAADWAALTELCLESKGQWGYDARFLEACEAELTFGPDDLGDHIAVIRDGTAYAGVIQVSVRGAEAELERLFVAPEVIGHGLGRMLLLWAVEDIRATGATRLLIASDPGAVGFYEAMGATVVGSVASVSIPGRRIPRLALEIG